FRSQSSSKCTALSRPCSMLGASRASAPNRTLRVSNRVRYSPRIRLSASTESAETPPPTTSESPYAWHTIGLGREGGDALPIVVPHVRFHVEQELGVLGLIGREHVVLREHILRKRVARLDHRGDDEV